MKWRLRFAMLHRPPAGNQHLRREGRPIWTWDDDFVARVQQDHRGVEKRLFGTVRDGDLFAMPNLPGLAGDLCGERFTQFAKPDGVGIAVLAAFNGGQRALADARREIGPYFSCGEVDDLLAGIGCRLGGCARGSRPRRRKKLRTLCQHCRPS